jgi:pectate lyase
LIAKSLNPSSQGCHRFGGNLAAKKSIGGLKLKTWKRQIRRVLGISGLCFGLPVLAMDCPVGWAAVNALGQNGTTGGGNGAVVHVTTKTAFATYAGSSTPYTIIIDGTSDGSWTVTNTVSVNSHKTIIGANAGIVFNGFGLDINGKQNIILRNLTIKNGYPDALSFRASHHIWIDHCDLSACYDGLLDISVGSDYGTVSWTKFHNHDKVSLVNGGTSHFEDIGKERMTYHHNWFADTVQRNPRIGYGKDHVFNNYYTNISSYCVGYHSQASVLVESNYFLSSRNPLLQSYTSDAWNPAYADARSVGNTFDSCAGTTSGTGAAFDPTLYYNYQFALDTASGAQATVKASAGSMATGATNLICPTPGNGTIDVYAQTNNLTWTGLEGVTSWDVYFGTTPSPSFQTNTTSRSFNPGTLAANTDYYWQVVADGPGGPVTSDLWRFRTALTNGSKPFPTNGAVHVPLRVSDTDKTTKPLELSWVPGLGAISHRVYLGTNAMLTDSDYRGSVTASVYAPGQLCYGATNYWRVDTVVAGGIIVAGPVWNFASDVTYSTAGRTEAENMVRGGTYYLNNAYSGASGGWIVRLEGGTDTSSPGAVSSIWNGPDAYCHFNVVFYDQVIGNGWFGFYVNNNKIAEWAASANDEKFHTNVIANVSINQGDEIRIAAYSDQNDFCGIDALNTEVLPGGPQPPGVPAGLIAAAGDAQIMLAWPIPSGATGYIVKRSTTNGGPYTSIATNSVNGYLDIGLNNGTAYYYVVSATNNAGLSADSSQVSASPVGITHSVLLAYEGFNYTTGTCLATSAGGQGWGTAWQTFNPGSYIATNTAAGLTYVALVTSGGAVQVGYPQPGAPDAANTTATPQRVLPATLGTLASTNDGVLWISFLMYNPIYPTSPGKYYRQSNLGFFSGASGTGSGGSEVAALGSPNTSATVTTNFAAWGGTVPGSAPTLSTVPSFGTNVQLVVIKLVVDNTTAVDYCYAWFNLNPALLGNNVNTPNVLTADLAFNGANLSSVNALRIQAGNYNGNGTNAFWTADELRLGTSFASVTPVSNFAPVLPVISNRTINVGVNLSITNVATDADVPTQTLTYSLPVAPANATIGSTSGVFTWRPLVTQAGTANPVMVVVADNGSPGLSATQSFNVIVNPLTQPAIASNVWSGGRFSLSVSGQTGPDYAVQVSSNLSSWNTLLITNSPAMPFNWTDPDTNTYPARFYRIKAGPPLP